MEHRASHKGKEGYHILSGEVTVDHTTRIIAATKRALNNKTVGKLEIQLIFYLFRLSVRFLTFLISFCIVVIVQFNGFVSDIREGKRYGNVEFDLIDKYGNILEEKGAYLIFDGGYLKWSCRTCLYKFTSVTCEKLWSEWIESVRKDVESTFGN